MIYAGVVWTDGQKVGLEGLSRGDQSECLGVEKAGQVWKQFFMSHVGDVTVDIVAVHSEPN